MPSVLPTFEYDIFISYRHNDNRSGWVTEFVNALQEELGATIKEPLTIYFDKNPHDGLLETHNVDKSLEGKLKCLIFIPIISQTYCDQKSFAWQNEFVVFNKLSKEDQFGRDLKLTNGNVASRILPIKIHDIGSQDKAVLESEMGGQLRAIEFIYREPGVNRPLKLSDDRSININKTDYRNQINKTANAISNLIATLQGKEGAQPLSDLAPPTPKAKTKMPTVDRKTILNLLLFVCLVVVCVLYFSQPALNNKTYKSFILAPDHTRFDNNMGGNLALSPDGTMLAFVALDSLRKSQLWMRPLNELDAFVFNGSEGAHFPFWSPDNRFIAFFASGKLKRIEVSSGVLQTICDVRNGRGGTWNRDGIIVFNGTALGGLLKVSASGGTPVRLTEPDTLRKEISHRWPSFLPDGQHFLYTSRRSPNNASEEDVIFLASLDTTVAPRAVIKASSNSAFVNGLILFVKQQTLMAQPFDIRALQPSGDAFPVAENIAFETATSRASFSVSENGHLVFQKAAGQSGMSLTWHDRNGNSKGVIDHGGKPFTQIRLSPDEEELVAADGDIWVHNLKRGTWLRLTFDVAIDRDPIWSPDGKTIAFASQRDNRLDLFKRATNGEGVDELLLTSNLNKIPSDWSRDGKYMVYVTVGRNADIWVMPMGASGQRQQAPFVFLKSDFNERHPAFSPDGRWIAYESDESGTFEIYVRPFPGPGGKWQVSSGGGTRPRWSADGKELFFLAQDSRILVATINSTNSAVTIGAVQPLFYQSYVGSAGSARTLYNIANDGKHFLLELSESSKVSTPVALVVNWQEEIVKK